ncbi:MAG: hypothetical protein HJJLKODD_00279 [Phycisphaerae bacterium]|nr:hypothetical protein [Phycisphaerae bacterium]
MIHHRSRSSPVRLSPYWRRHPWRSGLVALLLLLAILDHLTYPGWLGDDRTRYDQKIFTCVNVVDGDTLDINVPDGRYQHTRIRLWGVDTPEVAKSGRPEMHFGQQAWDYSKQRLLNQPVRIELAGSRTRDRWGRLLAYVYLADSNTFYNAELVTTGHAYADWRFDHPHLQEFLDREESASNQNVGLWVAITPDQMPRWRRNSER